MPPDPAQSLYRTFTANTLLWGQYFFAHHFRLPTPSFHLEILDAVATHRFLAVASPRESSKSTLLDFLDPFHDITFQLRHFILLISNTFKKSVMSLDTMKKELHTNELFQATFPGLTITKDAEGDSEFRHPNGYTTKVLCKGVDQIGSIRGVKFGAYRPDKIICDDIEDDELVRNPERRLELKTQYDQALVPAGEKGRCQYVNIGTLLHDDSLMADLVSPHKYPEYHKLFYAAHLHPDTSQERSLWPEKWTTDDLRLLRKTKPLVYAKEYQNDPIAGTNVRFARTDFRFWRLHQDAYQLLDPTGQITATGALSSCRAAIACDLAWKESREADYTAIVPGFLTPLSDILTFDYWVAHGVRPDQLSSYLFQLEARLRQLTGSHIPIGFEKAMLENVTQWLLKKEMRKRNRFLLTKPLVWDGDKISRAEVRLSARLTQHTLYFREGVSGELEHQLERFPYGTHDDLIDALQGLVQLLQFPKHLLTPKYSPTPFDALRQSVIDRKTRRFRPLYNGRKSLQNNKGLPAVVSPIG